MANLFLIDPHPIVRAGIRAVLAEEHQIAGEAADAAEAIARIEASLDPVDLAIIDPIAAGAVEQLLESFPQLRVVVFHDRAHDDGAAPAHAVVSKRRELARLRTAVDAALRGERFHDPVDEARPHDRLSPREHEVLRMVMRGLRPKEIALQLDLSVKTISTHRFRIMRKLGVDNDVTLMRYAFRHALAFA